MITYAPQRTPLIRQDSPGTECAAYTYLFSYSTCHTIGKGNIPLLHCYFKAPRASKCVVYTVPTFPGSIVWEVDEATVKGCYIYVYV